MRHPMNVPPPCRVSNCDSEQCDHSWGAKIWAANRAGFPDEGQWYLKWLLITRMFNPIATQMKWELESARYLPLTMHVKFGSVCSSCGTQMRSERPYWSVSPRSDEYNKIILELIAAHGPHCLNPRHG